MKQFTLPDLGEGVTEGQVLRLLVKQGETVEEDQLLMEVETDKAAVEIPSPHAGVIERWHVDEQQMVNVGDVMVTFADDDGNGKQPKRSVRTTAAVAGHAAAPEARSKAAGASPARRRGTRPPASPAVRKLARTLGIALEDVSGSGPGGRILRADVERQGDSDGPPRTPETDAPARERPQRPRETAATARPVEKTEPMGTPGTDATGPVRRAPVTQTRLAIAGMLTDATRSIPHVTDCDDADVTELDRLRRGYNETAPADGRLSLLPFVIRAVVRALQQHPIFNASYDEQRREIIYKRYYNIAIGVQTERGLVAPVLHDADTLSVPDIASALTALVERAHAGRFSLDDARGATYTISNAGAMGGSRYSTPIITPPQTAVLAVGRSRPMAWVVDGAVVPRLIMPLSHSMDHRVIDGALEIAFMRQVIGDLEHPARLLL